MINMKNFIPEKWQWNKDEQTWKYESGKTVSKKIILKIEKKIYNYVVTKNQQLNQQLLDKKVSLGEYKKQFLYNIKMADISMFLLYSGGAENVTIGNLKNVERNYKKKVEFFKKFVLKIKLGITLKEFTMRSQRYIDSIYATKSTANVYNKTKLGYTFAFRTLGVAEHCKDCINYAAMGIQPISDYIPSKTNCICQERCKCTDHFFLSFDDAVAGMSK